MTSYFQDGSHHIISDPIRLKLGLTVFRINMHQTMESDF